MKSVDKIHVLTMNNLMMMTTMRTMRVSGNGLMKNQFIHLGCYRGKNNFMKKKNEGCIDKYASNLGDNQK